MAVTLTVWAVEELIPEWEEWFLLPNTFFVDRKSAEFEIGVMREDYPNERYRIVKYARQG